MPELTSKQRAYLRSLAHGEKAIVHIGKEGVTIPTIRSIEAALNTRELIKIKVLETAPEDSRATGQILSARVEGSSLVQVIGRTVVLYRPHPKTPEIKLPR